MENIRSKIHVGDLIRALVALKPDHTTATNIAALLGFENLADSESRPKPSAARPQRQAARPQKWKYKPRKPAFSGRTADDLVVNTVSEGTPIKIPLPDLPEPLDEYSEENESLPVFIPLLVPIWTRSIVSKLLSVDTYSEMPDVDRLIDILTENQLVEQIPFEKISSLQKGVQVLVDAGPGLEPFMRDQLHLLQEIKNTVGREQVDVWEFTGTPLQNARSERDPQVETYTFPDEGTPILLLSDFGIASPPFAAEAASETEWQQFIDLAVHAGCVLIGLVPYHSDRWPERLRRKVIMIPWDYTTSVLTILQSY